MQRRRFLRYIAAAPPLLWIGCKGKPHQGTETLAKAGLAPRKCGVPYRAAGPGKVLNARQWAALDALTERLYPSDETPGARAAGVVGFIDDQLAHQPVKSFAGMITATLRFLDLQAKRLKGVPYASLAAADQDLLLRRLQQRRAGPFAGGRVLSILLTLTLEGLFGDPIYGGNRDGKIWSSVGFRAQRPAPRCPYHGLRRGRRA